MGPTQLNKIRADLLELYSGAEQLWGDSYACYDWGSLPGAVVHLKRYLVYRCSGGITPELRYGVGFTRKYSLPTGGGWLSFDLSSIDIAWGTVYIVSNPASAFEMDEAY